MAVVEEPWKRVIGDCPSAPEDPAKTRAAASEIVKMKPFLVYSGVSVAGQDVWSQNGIISVGAPYQASEMYAGRRPYRTSAPHEPNDFSRTFLATRVFVAESAALSATDAAGSAPSSMSAASTAARWAMGAHYR